MKLQKVLITKSQDKIDAAIKDGWLVHSVTPQYVAASSKSYYDMEGKFLIVFEKLG